VHKQTKIKDPTHDPFRLSLKKSFIYRAQAVFLGRLCLNGLYLTLWLFSSTTNDGVFPSSQLDMALILAGLGYALICSHYKGHKYLGRWLHFSTLLLDLAIHVFFTRSSGYMLSPLMAIHPFLVAAFLLLFHNPFLMLAPLLTLPLVMTLSLLTKTHFTLLAFSLIMNCGLDMLAIFFIHLAHSKEHRLLRSMVLMEKKLKELAVMKERQRISRDFHDGVGTKIASIVMQCDYLQLMNKENKFHTEITEIKESAIESIDDMRRSIAFLNGDFDITDQVDMIVEKIKMRHKLTIKENGCELLRLLNIEQQIACCRIIQEGLTNALKHAEAQQITIMVEKSINGLNLVIEDNGMGFEYHPAGKNHHYGIKNMQERALLIDARFTHSSQLNSGTKIFLEIPMG
jgi:two-component system sensor histidine kinase DegS